MKLLPLIGAVVIAVLAGIVPRFWLRVGAAVIAIFVGIDFVVIAVEWWGGRPAVPALAVAVGLFALGALLVNLAVRAKLQRVATR